MFGNRRAGLQPSGVENGLAALPPGDRCRATEHAVGEVRAETNLPAEIEAVDRLKDRNGSFAFRLVKIGALADC